MEVSCQEEGITSRLALSKIYPNKMAKGWVADTCAEEEKISVSGALVVVVRKNLGTAYGTFGEKASLS